MKTRGKSFDSSTMDVGADGEGGVEGESKIQRAADWAHHRMPVILDRYEAALRMVFQFVAMWFLVLVFPTVALIYASLASVRADPCNQVSSGGYTMAYWTNVAGSIIYFVILAFLAFFMLWVIFCRVAYGTPMSGYTRSIKTFYFVGAVVYFILSVIWLALPGYGIDLNAMIHNVVVVDDGDGMTTTIECSKSNLSAMMYATYIGSVFYITATGIYIVYKALRATAIHMTLPLSLND